MPTVADIEITFEDELFIGEDKLLDFHVKKADGTPQDVTGWTAVWVVRLTRYATDDILRKNLTLTATPAVDGILRATLVHADWTAAHKAGTFYQGIARTNAGAFDIVGDAPIVIRRSAASAIG